jgi:SAM-dependent methyltransferase
MQSDGRVLPLALHRMSCMTCGLGRRAESTRGDDAFASDYSLYAHAPGEQFEVHRQGAYARWLSQLIALREINSVFEIGSGNGSLLTLLRDRYPHLRLSGLEPSRQAAAFARAEGLDVRTGHLGAEAAAEADLVVCVNVIEHVGDPVEFLRDASRCITDRGQLLIICPDGERPSSELLFYDHVHSFTRDAMERVSRKAGLHVEWAAAAPPAIGQFFCSAMRKAGAARPHRGAADWQTLIEGRNEYLRRWSTLDGMLAAACQGFEEVICFGTGETAMLFRAYAPESWKRIVAFAVDGGGQQFDGKNVLDYRTLVPRAGMVILPAVRPEMASDVHRRLEEDGHSVINWHALTFGECV